ncbi:MULTISPECIES: RNA-binding domain-containing protein [Acidianus]|uniref:UPF0201 protein CM19_06085 n=1 Tax=Candidatus Acidianus copahuensis TaxID=1160895 RepID=A0A031LPC9_9CREN|nr:MULTISPECIES: RNA-binding domain-containing protein [Acidianus]EZQ06932.1 hypothetical protein CM19_06085 [Candidatus Acidianus copahuensis]NON62173.1 hypothetical protein [Acidianus sp. RZ1]
MTKIVVTAELRPSEDQDKVIKAIVNFFDFEMISKEKGGEWEIIVGNSTTLRSLVKLHRALREERILDAARKHLFRGISDNSLFFMIHKQAAASGVLAFVDDPTESPLGPITFSIECRNPREIIDWLTPRTSHGHPLWENPIPED